MHSSFPTRHCNADCVTSMSSFLFQDLAGLSSRQYAGTLLEGTFPYRSKETFIWLVRLVGTAMKLRDTIQNYMRHFDQDKFVNVCYDTNFEKYSTNLPNRVHPKFPATSDWNHVKLPRSKLKHFLLDLYQKLRTLSSSIILLQERKRAFFNCASVSLINWVFSVCSEILVLLVTFPPCFECEN